MKRVLTTTAAICTVLCIGATTYGQVPQYETRISGAWGTPGNWARDIGGGWVFPSPDYPGQSTPVGTVTVQHAMTVAVNDAAANLLDVDASLTINSNGIATVNSHIDADANITINTNGILIIEGAGTSDINTGCAITINSTGSSNYGTLRISADHTITTIAGGGKIEATGTSDDARITIDAGETLTNDATIEGRLQIIGDGSFTNNYVVDANTNGTLKLAVAGTLDDGQYAYWKATAANAILNFDSTIGALASLEGDLVIESGTGEIEVNHPLSGTGRFYMDVAGTLDVNEDVALGSSGNSMYMSAGSIDVASGKSFFHY